MSDGSASPFKGLRTVIYGVNDIERAKFWYESALQLRPYFDKPFYVGFEIGGTELGLDPNATPIGVLSAGVIAYWEVVEIENEFERLTSIGAKEHEKPHDVGGGMKTAIIVDPFGNLFGMYCKTDVKVEEAKPQEPTSSQ